MINAFIFSQQKKLVLLFVSFVKNLAFIILVINNNVFQI